jgi:CP family cyanate transporter-like MFS transporter
MTRPQLHEQRASIVVALGLSVMLVASNLRPAVAAVGPLLHRIEAGEGLSNAGATALTTLPVLCYGLVALAAPPLARRLGVHATVAVALAVLVSGQLVRLIAGVGFLFLGTALVGSSIGIGNVLMPVVVRRDFTEHTGTAMSVFSTTLMGFAALAAGLSVPVADALGGGWRPGLAIWAVPAALAAVAWLPALVRRSQPAKAQRDAIPAEPRPRDLRWLLRKPLAWQVTLFFAIQSGGFYATLAWLPSIFRSHGYSEAQAGFLLSINLIVGTLTGLVVPSLAHRLRDQRILVLASCLLAAVGWIGILAAPTTAPYLWVVVLGLGQNATFPLVMMLIVLRGGNVRTTQALSAMSQSVGYVLAAFAPLAVGAIHGLTHSWTPDVVLLLVMLLPQLLLGLGAGRRRQISLPEGLESPPRRPAMSDVR